MRILLILIVAFSSASGAFGYYVGLNKGLASFECKKVLSAEICKRRA